MRRVLGVIFSILLLSVSSLASSPTQQVGLAVHHMILGLTTVEGLDWKVGDTLNFDFKIKPIPLVASASLQVTQMTKDGMTLVEVISYKKLKLTIETVLDPNTGKVKSTKINGKPVKSPSSGGETKIITEEESHINVKAGEFDCIHVVTEGAQGSRSEIWINPSAVPITGMLKTSSVASFMTIEMELTSFVHGK